MFLCEQGKIIHQYRALHLKSVALDVREGFKYNSNVNRIHLQAEYGFPLAQPINVSFSTCLFRRRFHPKCMFHSIIYDYSVKGKCNKSYITIEHMYIYYRWQTFPYHVCQTFSRDKSWVLADISTNVHYGACFLDPLSSIDSFLGTLEKGVTLLSCHNCIWGTFLLHVT